MNQQGVCGSVCWHVTLAKGGMIPFSPDGPKDCPDKCHRTMMQITGEAKTTLPKVDQ